MSGLARALWRLSWPLVITLQLVSYAEAIAISWLGHLLGPPALAIEATMRHVFLGGAYVMAGVATGVSVLVSRSVGARDGRGLTIVANGVALCAALWLAAVAIVLPLGGPIGDALASPEVEASALRAYGLPWLLLALPGIGVVQVLLQAAAGAGWTRLSLARALGDLALTAIAVPVMIELAGLGAGGAPAAEGLVQLVVAAFVWRALWRGRERWALGEPAPPGRRLDPTDRALWWQLLDIGLPPQLARVAMLGAYAYLAQLVAADGSATVAAFGVSLALVFLAFGATAAIGRAAGILVGQSAGAGAWDRLRVTIRAAHGLGAAASCALVLALALAGRPLAALFTSEAEVVERAGATLQVLAWAIPFTAVSQVFLSALTAMRSSRSAGAAGIAADAAGVALALVLPGERRLEAVAWSIVASNAVRALLYAGLWRRITARRGSG